MFRLLAASNSHRLLSGHILPRLRAVSGGVLPPLQFVTELNTVMQVSNARFLFLPSNMFPQGLDGARLAPYACALFQRVCEGDDPQAAAAHVVESAQALARHGVYVSIALVPVDANNDPVPSLTSSFKRLLKAILKNLGEALPNVAHSSARVLVIDGSGERVDRPEASARGEKPEPRARRAKRREKDSEAGGSGAEAPWNQEAQAPAAKFTGEATAQLSQASQVSQVSQGSASFSGSPASPLGGAAGFGFSALSPPPAPPTLSALSVLPVSPAAPAGSASFSGLGAAARRPDDADLNAPAHTAWRGFLDDLAAAIGEEATRRTRVAYTELQMVEKQLDQVAAATNVCSYFSAVLKLLTVKLSCWPSRALYNYLYPYFERLYLLLRKVPPAVLLGCALQLRPDFSGAAPFSEALGYVDDPSPEYKQCWFSAHTVEQVTQPLEALRECIGTTPMAPTASSPDAGAWETTEELLQQRTTSYGIVKRSLEYFLGCLFSRRAGLVDVLTYCFMVLTLLSLRSLAEEPEGGPPSLRGSPASVFLSHARSGVSVLASIRDAIRSCEGPGAALGGVAGVAGATDAAKSSESAVSVTASETASASAGAPTGIAYSIDGSMSAVPRGTADLWYYNAATSFSALLTSITGSPVKRAFDEGVRAALQASGADLELLLHTPCLESYCGPPRVYHTPGCLEQAMASGAVFQQVAEILHVTRSFLREAEGVLTRLRGGGAERVATEEAGAGGAADEAGKASLAPDAAGARDAPSSESKPNPMDLLDVREVQDVHEAFDALSRELLLEAGIEATQPLLSALWEDPVFSHKLIAYAMSGEADSLSRGKSVASLAAEEEDAEEEAALGVREDDSVKVAAKAAAGAASRLEKVRRDLAAAVAAHPLATICRMANPNLQEVLRERDRAAREGFSMALACDMLGELRGAREADRDVISAGRAASAGPAGPAGADAAPSLLVPSRPRGNPMDLLPLLKNYLAFHAAFGERTPMTEDFAREVIARARTCFGSLSRLPASSSCALMAELAGFYQEFLGVAAASLVGKSDFITERRTALVRDIIALYLSWYGRSAYRWPRPAPGAQESSSEFTPAPFSPKSDPPLVEDLPFYSACLPPCFACHAAGGRASLFLSQIPGVAPCRARFSEVRALGKELDATPVTFQRRSAYGRRFDFVDCDPRYEIVIQASMDFPDGVVDPAAREGSAGEGSYFLTAVLVDPSGSEAPLLLRGEPLGGGSWSFRFSPRRGCYALASVALEVPGLGLRYSAYAADARATASVYKAVMLGHARAVSPAVGDEGAEASARAAPEILFVRSKAIAQASCKVLTSQISICTPSQLHVKVRSRALVSRCVLQVRLPAGLLDCDGKVVVGVSDAHGTKRSTTAGLEVSGSRDNQKRGEDAQDEVSIVLPVLDIEEDALVSHLVTPAGAEPAELGSLAAPAGASPKHLTAQKEFDILIPVRTALPACSNVGVLFRYAYLLPSLLVDAGLGLGAYSADVLDSEGAAASKLLEAINRRGADDSSSLAGQTISQVLASDESICIPVSTDFKSQVEASRHVQTRLYARPALAAPTSGSGSAALAHPYTLVADVCNLSDTKLLHIDSLTLAASSGESSEEVTFPRFTVHQGTSRVLLKEISVASPLSGLRCSLRGVAEDPGHATCQVALDSEFRPTLPPAAIRQSIHVCPGSVEAGAEAAARSSAREFSLVAGRPCTVRYTLDVSPAALKAARGALGDAGKPLTLRLTIPQGEGCNVVGGADVGLDDVLSGEGDSVVSLSKTVTLLWITAGRKSVPEYRLLLGEEEVGDGSEETLGASVGWAAGHDGHDGHAGEAGGADQTDQAVSHTSLTVPRSSVLLTSSMEVAVGRTDA